VLVKECVTLRDLLEFVYDAISARKTTSYKTMVHTCVSHDKRWVVLSVDDDIEEIREILCRVSQYMLQPTGLETLPSVP